MTEPTTLPAVDPVPDDRLYIPKEEAERLTSLCDKTLKRRQARGENIGRVQFSPTCVRYFRPALVRWAESLTPRPPPPKCNRPGASPAEQRTGAIEVQHGQHTKQPAER